MKKIYSLYRILVNIKEKYKKNIIKYSFGKILDSIVERAKIYTMVNGYKMNHINQMNLMEEAL